MENPELAIDVNTEESRQIIQRNLQDFQIQISIEKNIKKNEIRIIKMKLNKTGKIVKRPYM